MIAKSLADKITKVAQDQLLKGLDAKLKRMEVVREYYDLYDNQIIEVDGDVYNAPFPYFSNFIDNFQAKIDNPPSLDFLMPNNRQLSDKLQAAWEQEKSSSRAAWNRKDRAEKKQALITGRAVCKVYASSIGNEYHSHYEPVDIFSFVADPTRGQLMDGNYHGETDIFKTDKDLDKGVEAGFYDKEQVALLTLRERNPDADEQALNIKGKFDRIKAMGIDLESMSYAGQKGTMLCEWVCRYEGEWYYLLFDPQSAIWVRAEILKEAFKSGQTPYTSWATHYDEYNFWSKGLADDVAPVTESMRFLINNAIENEKRRVRPMRMVEGGSLLDPSEIQDYIPDNVIITQANRQPNIITIETPEISGTINLVDYLDSSSQAKVGVSDAAVQEKDAKVGIFFGQLQQEADRIGIINKEYSESYADKGYLFFWGLKQHLTAPKQVEMLGKGGIRMQMLERTELTDAKDVDDIIVSGGTAQDELDAVEKERQLKTLAELTAAYPQSLNPKWVIEQSLKGVGFEQDDVEQALDVEGSVNRELMEEADQAIQDILLNKTPRLNNGATVSFMQRIQDFITNELNWVKLDKKGNETGIDKKKFDQAQRLFAYMKAHQEIVVRNNVRKLREMQYEQNAQGIQEQPEAAQESIELPEQTEQQKQQATARPFESPTGTPEGTAETAQGISNTLTP